ncbi:MAG: caspase family protein [Vicinamibacteria bacterium]
MRNRALLVSIASLALAAAMAEGADVRRLALVVGANHGRPERVTLRYAVADAERFAAVMQRLGGVAPEDGLLLRDPGRRAFTDALEELRRRAGAARAAGQRAEVVLYFSGHADEQGLMLGRDGVSYREVRDAMQDLAADVGITVLDACGSGVITRLKGGRPRPAFLTDESMRVQGQAFLTSSSENEAAQESERLQGSFFTHALVSGLRGAADASGDGRVTLGEAYQFAFQETLAQTTSTRGGAQHPAYDIRMAGTGDVVMTDVRQASAALVLGPELQGRFFVRDGRHRLVAELFKPGGRNAEIAVEPGSYEVQLEQGQHLYRQEVAVADGQRHALARADLAEMPRGATTLRGGAEDAPPFALAGRNRFELSGLGGGMSGSAGGFFTTGFSVLRWPRESLALEGAAALTTRTGGSTAPSSSLYTTTGGSFELAAGLRLYLKRSGPFRPFLRATVGPLVLEKTDHGPAGSVDYRDGVVSTWLGAGVDWQKGRHFAMTVRLGWRKRTDAAAEPTYGLTLGYAFGRPRPR